MSNRQMRRRAQRVAVLPPRAPAVPERPVVAPPWWLNLRGLFLALDLYRLETAFVLCDRAPEHHSLELLRIHLSLGYRKSLGIRVQVLAGRHLGQPTELMCSFVAWRWWGHWWAHAQEPNPKAGRWVGRHVLLGRE